MTLRNGREFLALPGPTTVPDEVLAAMHRPALDIYSAAFTVMFKPLPPQDCPMPDALRATFEEMDDAVRDAFDPILLEHRDFIYQTHLDLPLTLVAPS